MPTLRTCLIAALVIPALVIPTMGSPAAARAPRAGDGRTFDPARFTNPVTVDNRWLPLVPGTRYVYDGDVTEADGVTPHQNVLTVTDVTKVIDGVETLVLWEVDKSDGELEEEELAFVAQADDGTVWNLGEYPEEHEDGRFVGAPGTWISGQARAEAGIAMLSAPEVGTPAYRQGYAPDVDFEDRARVEATDEKTCVPVDCYRDVVVIDEWNPQEQPQDGHQLKYHVPGVGNVRVKARGGESQENLELVRLDHLGAKERAAARDRVLKLDRRAYTVAKDVYGSTPRAKPMAK